MHEQNAQSDHQPDHGDGDDQDQQPQLGPIVSPSRGPMLPANDKGVDGLHVGINRKRLSHSMYHSETNPHFALRSDQVKGQDKTKPPFTRSATIDENEPMKLQPQHHHKKPTRQPLVEAEEEPPPRDIEQRDQDGRTIDSQTHIRRSKQSALTSSNRQVAFSATCSVFWAMVLIFGIAILILHAVFHPLSPRFGVSNASLSMLHLDKDNRLSANLTLTTNFTNPNKKASFGLKYIVVELYFGRTLLSAQNIEPFSLPKAQTRSKEVQMIATRVQLYKLEIARLERLAINKSLVLEVKGNYLANSRLLRNSFWLHGLCRVRLTRPPHGVLVSGNCNIKH